jgi:mono/diheme cytochrome c family protein
MVAASPRARKAGQMTFDKMSWLIAGVVCLFLLAACGPEAPPVSSAGSDEMTGAPEELHRELVPGLDLWSRKRKGPPPPEIEAPSPEYLARAERHREFMQAGVPVEYRGRTSPYPATKSVILDGGRLYQSHCVRCHGATGQGDGQAGRDLSPPPALLAYLIDRPQSVDEYLLWTISEGGKQFGTGMPAFKQVLTEQEIWQIVVYMRAGFPTIEKVDQD